MGDVMNSGACMAFDEKLRGYSCDRVLVTNNVYYAIVLTYLINAFSVIDIYRITSW